MKYIRKLNTKGFAHIEAAVIIVVLVAIGGTYVAIEGSHALTKGASGSGGGKTSVPPYADWTLVDTVKAASANKPTIKLYDCVAKKDPSGKGKEVIDSMAVLSSKLSSSVSKTYWLVESSGYGTKSVKTNSWGSYRQPESARESLTFSGVSSKIELEAGTPTITYAYNSPTLNKIVGCEGTGYSETTSATSSTTSKS